MKQIKLHNKWGACCKIFINNIKLKQIYYEYECYMETIY